MSKPSGKKIGLHALFKHIEGFVNKNGNVDKLPGILQIRRKISVFSVVPSIIGI